MQLSRRKLLLGAGGAFLAGKLPASATETVRLSGRSFGTTWMVTLPPVADPDGIHAQIRQLLSEIDMAMSPFRPDSEISRFNRDSGGKWYAVSPAFAYVATEALRVAALTGGAFDPTVGPDVGRYGFGPMTGKRAGSYLGLQTSPDAIRKDVGSLSLDLCGIAKGYALDAVTGHLEKSGFADFFIEIGGEVLAHGKSPTGRPWLAGIADPVRDGLLVRLPVSGFALATSGDAVNAYEVAGRRYSHIIDPATDEPVLNDVASVTVAAPLAMTADALATAMMVRGADRGLELANALDIPVLYLRRKEGGLLTQRNAAFDRLGQA